MLGVTGFVWDHERQISRKIVRSQFEFSLRETVSRIEQQVQGYEQMLRGVQSLFAVTDLRNRDAVHNYVEALQLDANFSGIQAIGIVEWVSEERRPEHIASMRTAGFPNYRLEPGGLRDFYAPIVQREPYIGRNRAAPGSDVWADSTRRIAMERARDSGMAAISGKVKLKVDGSDVAPPGFVMYLPVYASDKPRDSLQQRRAHLVGWVYASFHMNVFMASLYGGQSPGLSLSMYDGTEISEATLLYSSTPNSVEASNSLILLHANEYMVVAGHHWTLSLRTQAAFHEQYGRSAAAEMALAGSVLSGLLALLAWMMINGRARALNLASQMTEEIRLMAQLDPLTRLPNRALFDDRLSQELARAKRQGGKFALLFLDLDGFKPINDRHGHGVGDLVLKWVADQLKTSVRATDTVGRVGGDEFVLLLAQLHESDSIFELAEKIRLSLKQPIDLGGEEMHISCSIGIAVYPQSGTDAVELTKCADEAMYRAKEAGRDCVRLCDLAESASPQ